MPKIKEKKSDEMIKRDITLFSLVFIICFLCVFLIPILSDVIMKIDLLFYIKSVSVYQGGSNSTYFRVINEYNGSLYYVTPKYLSSNGIYASFNVNQIQELDVNARPVILATIFANENVLNGTHAVNFWVESMDADGNKVKSQTYTIDVNVLTNSTPKKITSTMVSTSTSIPVSTISELTTTSEPPSPSDNEMPSGENEKGISKKPILIVLAIVVIILILMPMLSLKGKSSQGVSTPIQENESKS
jgi:hypothetical protein